MEGNVQTVAHVEVKPGKLAAFRAIAEEMATVSKSERGTIGYERFFSEDNQSVHVFERFTDSAAALAHLGSMQPLIEKFLDACEMKSLVVYGAADAELVKALSGFGATFHKQVLGFNRF